MITSTQERTFAFFGQGSKLFSIYVLNMILTIVTLGLYYPWAQVAIMKYLYEETELEGSRFMFHGTGKEMFIGMIKAIVIFGSVYGAFLLLLTSGNGALAFLGVLFFYAAMLVLIPFAIHGSMKYRMSRTSWRGIHFGYRGDRMELVTLFIKEGFLTIITLGIYGFWMTTNLRRYILSNVRFGNVEFRYAAQGSDFFAMHLKGYFLTCITLGVYGFWYLKDQFNFWIENIHLIQGTRRAKLRSTATGSDYFFLVVPNILLIIFTLGLGTPWAMIRTMNFIFANIAIEGELDTDNIQQTEGAYKDATGVEVADMLDLDLV